MNGANPAVTVLMPVYNGEKYLAEAIESILIQHYQNYEFLIINDGSTDKSIDCIKSYNDPRIRVINNNNNIGLVDTLNEGLRLATGQYIARFDQDDISLPNRLKMQVEFLESHKDYSAVCSWMHTINSNGRKIREYKEVIKNYGDFIGIIISGKVPLYHPVVMYKKADIIGIDGYDKNYPMAEDYDLWRRMALNRMNVAFIQKYHLLQRQHNKRATTINFQEYLDAGNTIQLETVEMFSNNINNSKCLSALLRLAPDPCGNKYRKNHLIELTQNLDEVLENVVEQMSLSMEERITMKNRIFQRLGFGVQHIRIFSNLPGILFYPIFYTLSPLLLPKIYLIVSKIYRKVRETYFQLKKLR